jgi:hypothetical protein
LKARVVAALVANATNGKLLKAGVVAALGADATNGKLMKAGVGFAGLYGFTK